MGGLCALALLIGGVGVYSLMAVGLTLIFGVMRVVNFAHGDMMIWGMYLAWILSTRAGIDPERIGVIGQSFGAAVAVYAAGVDRRVAACISSGGWGDGARKFRKQHASSRAWIASAALVFRGRTVG